jgi:cobalamin biosynthesis Co2+ chelatase CbiK/NAD-dependent dihydropyrimidine dehydrogenase PreA subunit
MPYRITEACLACDACENECANRAISSGDIYRINPDRCTECIGIRDIPRCVEVCPARAVELDNNHKETYDQQMAKWLKLHPGERPKGLVLLQDRSKPVIALIADGSADKPGEKMLEKFDTMIRGKFPGHDVVWGIQAIYMFAALKARGQNWYFERQVPLMDAATLLGRLAAAGRQKVAMQFLMTSESTFSREPMRANTHGMQVKYAMPFFTPKENIQAIVKALEPEFGDGKTTATVFAGHGALKDFEFNECFMAIDRILRSNYKNAFLATLHGPPGIDGVVEDVKKSGCKKVKFVSLMITGGGHITQDIMGDEPESWKSRMGLPGEVFTGIAEKPVFQNYFPKQVESLLAQFK